MHGVQKNFFFFLMVCSNAKKNYVLYTRPSVTLLFSPLYTYVRTFYIYIMIDCVTNIILIKNLSLSIIIIIEKAIIK